MIGSGLSQAVTTCRSCGSENQTQFVAENYDPLLGNKKSGARCVGVPKGLGLL